MDNNHAIVGLERSVELKAKEMLKLKSEIDKFHHEGTHVPQLETRFSELKQQLIAIIHADEVDPQNEWAVKANELL